MAGKGTRFLVEASNNPEYLKPKPLIDVMGKPMIQWALESLPFVDLPGRSARTKFKVDPSDLIFVALEDHQSKYGIDSSLRKIFGNDINVLLIPEVTRGALETAIKAKELINHDEDLIVSDSDHYFDGNELYNSIMSRESSDAGVIPVFKPNDNDPKWSYTLFGKDFYATRVDEKNKDLADAGAYANIGAYYFSSGKVFVNVAEGLIKEGSMSGPESKKEFYVAPIFDRMINIGMRVKVAISPQVWGLGTPKDLEYFLSNYQ